uniref:Uncharacterized protein n=1 Tax=Homo sapiens TaxID=9606 RepID=A4D1M9_HUMAN|nr:hypothetical protein FLJ43663 [Homo sapiens]
MSTGSTHAQTPRLPDAVAPRSGLLQRQKPLRDASRGSRWVEGVKKASPPLPAELIGWLVNFPLARPVRPPSLSPGPPRRPPEGVCGSWPGRSEGERGKDAVSRFSTGISNSLELGPLAPSLFSPAGTQDALVHSRDGDRRVQRAWVGRRAPVSSRPLTLGYQTVSLQPHPRRRFPEGGVGGAPDFQKASYLAGVWGGHCYSEKNQDVPFSPPSVLTSAPARSPLLGGKWKKRRYF